MDNLGQYKSWVTSFPTGRTLYKSQDTFVVLSAGTDFLVLKNVADGKKVRLFRNTPESLEYFASPILFPVKPID